MDEHHYQTIFDNVRKVDQTVWQLSPLILNAKQKSIDILNTYILYYTHYSHQFLQKKNCDGYHSSNFQSLLEPFKFK